MDAHSPGLLVKGGVARSQLVGESAKAAADVGAGPETGGTDRTMTTTGTVAAVTPKPAAAFPRRFHGTVTQDSARVGLDASRVAEEVIAHLSGLWREGDGHARVGSADSFGGVGPGCAHCNREQSGTQVFESGV